MTNNPHAPEGNYDPAGSTQMFRAFVDEAQPRRQASPAQTTGPRLGVAFGVLVVVAIVAAVAWLALS
ncbi:hypothetical protein [Streptomyces sp. 8N616]|uniref:hypothetical protein n=1 Tax=Streptomyces sp. 8N616 TaxID=3457414 RepID=UPI003FD0A319